MQRLLPVLILAALLVSPATAYTPDTLTVTFLAIGQGDAILVQAPNGRAMLVDAGESWAAPAVSAGLAAEGIGRLEYVVATHDHADHIGGMTAVLPAVTVGRFVTNGVPASTQTAANLRTYLSSRGIPSDTATAGETLALDPANVTVTVLNPPAAPGTDQNEASVVLRLAFGSQSFLLAGDAGTTAEGWMLAAGRPVAARVLKVGHHGSSTATAAALVAAVDPAVAVVESGAFNSYGHPDQAVVKRLQDSGAKVYSTASSGTVRIAATRTGHTVVTADGPELPVTVLGVALPPTDLDFDGDFENVNGNQRRDFADVVMVFNQLDWIAANEPAGRPVRLQPQRPDGLRRRGPALQRDGRADRHAVPDTLTGTFGRNHHHDHHARAAGLHARDHGSRPAERVGLGQEHRHRPRPARGLHHLRRVGPRLHLPVVRARGRGDGNGSYQPRHEHGHRPLLGPRLVGLEQYRRHGHAEAAERWGDLVTDQTVNDQFSSDGFVSFRIAGRIDRRISPVSDHRLCDCAGFCAD